MLFESLINVLLGMALGMVGGLFGIGGGLIAIPVLGILFGLDQQLAQGTALVMVVPNVLLAIWRYNQRNRIDWRNALALALPSLLFAYAGAAVAVRLEAAQMRWIFVGFLLFLAAWSLLQVFMAKSAGSDQLRHPWPWLGVLGSTAGLMGGLFAVGGAVIAAPILTSVFGLSQFIAQGLALALAAPSTLIALATYTVHEHVDWVRGVPLAIGGLLSISWGVRLAHAMPEAWLRAFYCGFLVLCAVLLAFKA